MRQKRSVFKLKAMLNRRPRIGIPQTKDEARMVVRETRREMSISLRR
jgi:hypothetical protein